MLALAVLALASGAMAQSVEYAITNCTAYDFKGNIHHAYSYDCREFFNCDNAGGGKTVKCPSGTLFDRNEFVCTDFARCDSWDREVCYPNSFSQQRDPNANRNYAAAYCCNWYYAYSCADNGMWKWTKCPPNTQFDPNTRSCQQGLNRQDCIQCNTNPSAADMCTGTHLIAVSGDECQYSYRLFPSFVSRCAQGTFFDPQACQCVRSVDANKCRVVGQQCVDGDRSYLDFTAGGFMAGGKQMYVGLVNEPTWTTNSLVFSDATKYAEIYYFRGQTVGPNGGMRMTFTPSAAGSFGVENTILSTGMPGQAECAQGTRVTITATQTGGNQMRISARVDGYNSTTSAVSSADISATVTANVNQPIQLIMIAQQQLNGGYTISGKVKGGFGGAVTMNGQANVNFYGTTNAKCGLQLGRFVGSISEFAAWRCDNPILLLNQFN